MKTTRQTGLHIVFELLMKLEEKKEKKLKITKISLKIRMLYYTFCLFGLGLMLEGLFSMPTWWLAQKWSFQIEFKT